MIYLASPYSHEDVKVREYRFQTSAKAASTLMKKGIHVFSPISHTHPIAMYGLPLGWDFWEQFDRWYIERCDEVWVLMLDGWQESRGVTAEIGIATEMGKVIRYLEEDFDPDAYMH